MATKPTIQLLGQPGLRHPRQRASGWLNVQVIASIAHMPRELRRGGCRACTGHHDAASCCLELHCMSANMLSAPRTADYASYSG